MNEAKITHVIHIAATRKKVWQVLTSSKALKDNWGNIQSE